MAQAEYAIWTRLLDLDAASATWKGPPRRPDRIRLSFDSRRGYKKLTYYRPREGGWGRRVGKPTRSSHVSSLSHVSSFLHPYEDPGAQAATMVSESAHYATHAHRILHRDAEHIHDLSLRHKVVVLSQPGR